MMSFSRRNKKVAQFFEKIFDDDFELNNYHADKILKCLEDASICGLENKLIDSSFFSDIILKSYNGTRRKSNSVEKFIGKLLTIMFRNELHFNKLIVLMSTNRLRMFMCKSGSCATSSDMILAFTNIATSLISHYSGISWLVDTKMWRYVLCECTHTRPVEVSRAAYNFTAQLVWKINDLEDEAVLTEIFEYITEPIIMNRYHSAHDINVGAERQLYAPMLTYLNALLAVLSDTENIIENNRMVPVLMKHFNLKENLQIILDVTRDTDLASILCELLFKLYGAAAKDAFRKGKITKCEVMNEITLIYNNIICKLIMKQMSEAITNYVVKCNLYLAKLCKEKEEMIFERDGKRFDFRNQFISHLVVPLWTYYALNCGSEVKLDAITNFSCKIVDVTAEHIVLSATLFQTIIENHSYDLKKVTIHTIKNFFHFKGQLNKPQAGILYQGLFYVLKTFIMSDDVDANLILNENPLKTPDDIRLLVLVLDAIKMLLKEHDINWYENLEIICLQETLMNLLKQKCLSTKTLVQTLDLIDIGVKKFLSPDMTLLVENKNESSLAEIGAITKEYMQHQDWEVRESALSLLLSCTQLSFVKYVPFQKLILENKLLLQVAYCALKDPEVYPQATALQCLAAATKIDRIWLGVVEAYPNLHTRLVNIVINHHEEVIRKEAVNVLTAICANQNVTSEYRDKIFKVMVAVVLNDVNWEVQMATLNFWRQSMVQFARYRGVIDGKFPSVTFSKEKKKIITFNDSEIKRQLNNILNDLSKIGCFNVFDKFLDDESNVALIEETYKLLTEVTTAFTHYNFTIENMTKPLLKPPAKENKETSVKMDIAIESCDLLEAYEGLFDFREVVIEQILDVPRNELIMDIFKNCPDKQQEEPLIKDCITEYIHAYDFWQKFQSNDYASLIAAKRKWITGHISLDELIDEILTTDTRLQHNDIVMCYM